MSGLDDYIAGRQAEAAAENVEVETENTEVNTESTEVNTESTEVNTETTEVNTETTEVNTEPAVEINDEQLNTFFGTTGKTKDDFNNALTVATKVGEIESRNSELAQELDSLRSSHAALKKELDPLSYFSSQEAYVAEQLRKKYPTMDAVAIQKAVTQDVSEMSDIDVLALHDTIKRPGARGGEEMAKKILADDYGVDLSEPSSQWDEIARGKIERAAFDARQEIKTFSSEVEMPSAKSEEDRQADRAQAAEALKAEWEPITPKLTSFDKITIPGQEGEEAFEFEVPQSFRDELGGFFEAMITQGELEPTEETISFLIEQRNKEFIYQNLDKIRASIVAAERSAAEERLDRELNNTSPANTNTAPASTEEVGGTEQHLSQQKGRFRV